MPQLQSQPLVTVVGPSGSGKSSLVRAGVIPALKRSGDAWGALVLRPGRRPLDTLASMLTELSVTLSSVAGGAYERDKADSSQSVSAEALGREPGLVGRMLRAWSHRNEQKLVLFVDQFEELYTLGADSDERIAFVTCLEGAADDASSPLRVVLSIRSDFLDRVVEDNRFMADVTRGLVLLPPIDRDGLRDALTRPVVAAGYEFESEALVDTMLDALEATPGALPLLQFTASKLWETRDRDRRLLTADSYDAIGGVAGTLASHADAVLAGMSTPRMALARAIFQRLVTPERTRAITSLQELCELPGEPGEIEVVVEVEGMVGGEDHVDCNAVAVDCLVTGAQGQDVAIDTGIHQLADFFGGCERHRTELMSELHVSERSRLADGAGIRVVQQMELTNPFEHASRSVNRRLAVAEGDLVRIAGVDPERPFVTDRGVCVEIEHRAVLGTVGHASVPHVQVVEDRQGLVEDARHLGLPPAKIDIVLLDGRYDMDAGLIGEKFAGLGVEHPRIVLGHGAPVIGSCVNSCRCDQEAANCTNKGDCSQCRHGFLLPGIYCDPKMAPQSRRIVYAGLYEKPPPIESCR